MLQILFLNANTRIYHNPYNRRKASPARNMNGHFADDVATAGIRATCHEGSDSSLFAICSGKEEWRGATEPIKAPYCSLGRLGFKIAAFVDKNIDDLGIATICGLMERCPVLVIVDSGRSAVFKEELSHAETDIDMHNGFLQRCPVGAVFCIDVGFTVNQRTGNVLMPLFRCPVECCSSSLELALCAITLWSSFDIDVSIAVYQ